ncbi:ABC transporter permease [Blautia producta]|uniref:Macrolide export ATP-binding/permease protein MacB n=1 Tax=Blautia producta TaxID=33035 RepID=A0A4P6M397_9FIRM|nr:ABC transporter permease [Blautia producta]QBE98966.1 Macrolide export ATP-binding/permease protein MacB [Blautia producta]
MMIQSLKMAWNAVCSNKMRTFLTMLGIIIGVIALVVLVSIADGATSSVTDQISGMGSNYLTVTITDDKENPLRLLELSDFTENENIEETAPFSRTSVTAKSGYVDGTMTLIGTTGSYLDIQNLELAYGRNIKNTDVENNSYVVILTKDSAKELFGYADAVGETVALDGRSFLVIGILDEEESASAAQMSTGSEEESSSVMLEGYIPYSTMTRIADNILYVTQFYASASSEDTMDFAELSMEQMMLERFGGDEDAFSIVSQSELMETMESVTNTLSLMLGGIAAISLLVGGIGIMNIMLVSVTERTREIGIRKAIGAGRGSIMMQFLIEALLVSLMGCLIGIGASWGILRLIGEVSQDAMNFSMAPEVVWTAVAFSGVIGVLFGLYPANKAAKKRPIDALRYSG